MDGYARRANMLATYNYEHARLTGILGDKRTRIRDKSNRLAALQEAYPAKSAKELEDWFTSEPADIAETLVAEEFASTAESVHKYLSQARQERDAYCANLALIKHLPDAAK